MLEDHHREQKKEEYAHVAEEEKLAVDECEQKLCHMAEEENRAADERAREL